MKTAHPKAILEKEMGLKGQFAVEDGTSVLQLEKRSVSLLCMNVDGSDFCI